MTDFQCHFQKEDVTIAFREESSPHTVCVNGHHYALEGDREKVAWLKERLFSSS